MIANDLPLLILATTLSFIAIAIVFVLFYFFGKAIYRQFYTIRRFELIVFLLDAFFYSHSSRKLFGCFIFPIKSFGMHFIGIFDLLRAAGCDIDVATAGALHSLYEDDQYYHHTMMPSVEDRRNIRCRFGERVENLIFLYHSCNHNINSLSNIESGRLYNRINGMPLNRVSIEDTQALRLIEAARMMEIGLTKELSKLPSVCDAWHSQLILHHHRRSLDDSSTSSKIRKLLPRALEGVVLRMTRSRSRGIQLRVFTEGSSQGHSYWFPLQSPFGIQGEVDRNYQVMHAAFTDMLRREELLRHGNKVVDSLLDGRRDIVSKEHRVSSTANEGRHILFSLRGEVRFGMPWTPLWMLNRCSSRSCGTRPSLLSKIFRSDNYNHELEIEIKRSPSVPNVLSPTSIDGDSTAVLDSIDTMTREPMITRDILSSFNASQIEIIRGIAAGNTSLRPASVPFSSFSAASGMTTPSSRAAAASVIESMRTFGYAVISVDDEYKAVIEKSYAAILDFHQSVSMEHKNIFYRCFDSDRYVGFAKDPGREWLQMRACTRDDEAATYGTLNDGMLSMPWPAGVPRGDVNAMTLAVRLLTRCAEDIFEEVGLALGLGSRQALRRLVGKEKNNNYYPKPDSVTVPGTSVCRLFVYTDKAPTKSVGKHGYGHGKHMKKDMKETGSGKKAPGEDCSMRYVSASGAHADMGLLTLSPASTIPALHLLHPWTQETLAPEVGLSSNEWVLFAGETLAFLTEGAIQAPIHSVPFIDRQKVATQRSGMPSTDSTAPSAVSLPPLRRSMPLFLRADPDAYLFPLSQEIVEVNLRQVSKGILDAPIPVATAHAVSETSDSPVPMAKPVVPSDVTVHHQILSTRVMTCREFTLNHALGIRPWRLTSTRSDF